MKHKEARKARVLKAIATFQSEHGYSPSYRDLGGCLGMAHSLIHGYVKELRSDGLIDERDPKVNRALTLTDAGRVLVSTPVNSTRTGSSTAVR